MTVRIATCVLILLCAGAARSFAQTGESGGIPRLPDGRPNLQGIWQVRSRAAYDLEDHVARQGMPAGRSVVDGGAIPYQRSALARRQEHFANRASADPVAQCYMPGVPRLMYMEFPFQIFQTRDHVAMAFEWQQIYRLIPTNGSTPTEGLEFWMGDSRGRWEGDTLVVETTNFTDAGRGSTFTGATKHMVLVERFRRADADTIDYRFTVTDPETWARPWTAAVPWHRPDGMLYEYACHEGNYGLENTLRAARTLEKEKTEGR